MAYQPPSPSFEETKGRTIASILDKKKDKNSSINLFDGVKKLISSLRINQKISYGYGLAIGIGVLGTLAGLKVGNYYETQAENQLNYATGEYNLLNSLRYTVLEAQFHQQRLVPVIGNSIWLKQEIFEFNKSITVTKKILHRAEVVIRKKHSI